MRLYSLLLATLALLATNTTTTAQTNPEAKINMTLVAPETAIGAGETFEVPVLMSAATEPQRYIVADILFGWNPDHLEFVGISHDGSHPMIWRDASGLPYCPPGQTNGCGDFYGINEALPPADGNGLYYGYGELGSVLIVDEQPVQIVKFIFRSKGGFTETNIDFIPELTVNWTAKTVVYGSYIPGNRVTGTLTGCIVTGQNSIQGDFDGNGFVNSADMSMLLANWNATSFKENPYDLNGDGVVNSGDLAVLLANWTG